MNFKTAKEFLDYLMEKWFIFYPDKIEIHETNKNEIRLYLYTEKHKYTITILKGSNNDYLGGLMSNRSPLPGETWIRGSDLTDGKLNLETWNFIISDILKFELLKIERKVNIESR